MAGRRYPPQFRRDAVALVRSSDKTIRQLARELGSTVRRCATGSAPNALTRVSWKDFPAKSARSYAGCAARSPS
jgi:hypothetical protein